ncbi:MAG: DUF692 domain-containing protein [Pseudomonadales bacterium]|nr:DUF692 domain-containing protein [Pseudomonadales bacterium]
MSLPAHAGLGLRDLYMDAFTEGHPEVAWLEVHSENYFCGGPRRAGLLKIREDYPISLHGVGLGLGSAVPLDLAHLSQLKHLIDDVKPAQVSEHLCWNRDRHGVIHDLLPLPMTEAALACMVEHVDQTQNVLGCSIAIEHITRYMQSPFSEMSELQMLTELVRRTGCSLLLDVNNLEVNRRNHGDDPYAFIQNLPLGIVSEIHIAGYSEEPDGSCVDTHGSAVSEEVWSLLEQAIQRLGSVPVLLERDTALPPLEDLMQEVQRAEKLL